MSGRISEWLIDPDADAGANVEKLLTIADALMRQVELSSGERGAAYAQFRRAAALEDLVRQRTRDLEVTLKLLNDTNARLAEANAARVRFVAAASHDLLQPLSAAKLFVAAARDDGGAGNRGALEKAHKALASVENILGALLDISRLESGGAAVEIAPIPLGVLLAQLTDEFAPVAAGKGLRLDILPCRLTVSSDPTYLRRILQNLIGNAIRYTDRGRILVGTRRHAGSQGGRVRVEVHDTGPGIAPDQQQAIFREFHRVDGSASASEGLGLGLAIVERACALLDHRLSLRSEPGRGTCFAVELRTAPQHARRSFPAAAPVIPEEPGDAGDRIALLVENDDNLRRAIALLLERRGVNVLEAASGEEALALLDEVGIVPDLYLIDHHLGDGMTGVETIRALRAQYGDRPTRLITASRTREVRAAADAAAVEIMFKPIDPRVLEAFVLEG